MVPERGGKRDEEGVLHYDELAEDNGTIHDTKEKSSQLGSYNFPNPTMSRSAKNQNDDDTTRERK